MCFILEVDKRWVVGFGRGKYYIAVALGFVALTIWFKPYYKVMDAIRHIDESEVHDAKGGK